MVRVRRPSDSGTRFYRTRRTCFSSRGPAPKHHSLFGPDVVRAAPEHIIPCSDSAKRTARGTICSGPACISPTACMTSASNETALGELRAGRYVWPRLHLTHSMRDQRRCSDGMRARCRQDSALEHPLARYGNTGAPGQLTARRSQPEARWEHWGRVLPRGRT